MDRIVCDCNDVTEDMVREYIAKNKVIVSDWDTDEQADMYDELDIGTACGCCLEADCDVIDVSIWGLLQEIEDEQKD